MKCEKCRGDYYSWTPNICEKCAEELQGKYMELIMAVAKKFPDETRHQTALRYIMKAETSGSCELTQTDTAGESLTDTSRG